MTHKPRTLGAALACLCALGVSTPAQAQQRQQGQSLDAFEVGKLSDQLELDVTPVPVGMGALFVPSLTDPGLEPRVLVLRGQDRVASGAIGKRIVLPPGRYTVLVGHGPISARAQTEVEVIDGVTTPVEPFFGAVRVSAINLDGAPQRREYVIATAGGDVIYGPIDTSDAAEYGKTPTWLLPPGRYILALGDDPQSERDRVAFVVTPGEVTRYRLVVAEDRLLRADFADTELVYEPSIFKLQWVVGADFGLDQTSRQLSTFNGQALRVGAFTNATVGIDTGNHLAQITLGVDESWLGLDATNGRGLPLQKLTDEINAEVLYNYRLGGILGPYIRGTMQTALFDTFLYPDRDLSLRTTSPEGQVEARQVSAGQEVMLFEAFKPMQLQQGAGLGLTLLDNDVVSFSLRGGVAARQSWYGGGRVALSSQGDSVRLLQLSDKRLYGAEATAHVGLRLGRTLSYQTVLDSFMPQAQIFTDDEFRPVYRWHNVVTLSVGRFAAIVYNATLHRDDPQIGALQMRQNLSLRLQHTLF